VPLLLNLVSRLRVERLGSIVKLCYYGFMTRSSVDLEEAGPASFEELRVRDCSIKRTLDVIGERWTLLVLREAFYGARRFEQFLANVGCARSLLSERLATLVEQGEPYREPG